MKKVLFTVAALSTMALVSCKKDFTCKCTSTFGGVTTTYKVIYKESKKNAAYAACEGKGIGSVTDENGNTYDDNTTCTIE